MRKTSENVRIILLGSKGFLGSHLYSTLVRLGYPVICVDSNLASLESNYRNSRNYIGKTVVISMAWSSNSSRRYLNSPENLVWALKHIEIAKFCLKEKILFVVPGTCLEYGENERLEYVRSKVILRRFLEENMPPNLYLWLRYFYVFSIAHRRPGLVRDALEAKDESKPFIISNIRGCHDYIEVRDAVAQTIELIKGLYSGVWDIGVGLTRSNLDLLSRIGDLEIVESCDFENSNKPSIGWEGSAKKLILNHTQFTTHTNQFFDTLLP